MANEIRIKLSDPDSIKLNFNDRIVLKYVEPNHSKLSNLDYENSGHTGFMPSRPSLLPDLPKNVENNRISLLAFNTNDNEACKIDLNDFAGRIIKTVSSVPSDSQKGQYLFLQINEED